MGHGDNERQESEELRAAVDFAREQGFVAFRLRYKGNVSLERALERVEEEYGVSFVDVESTVNRRLRIAQDRSEDIVGNEYATVFMQKTYLERLNASIFDEVNGEGLWVSKGTIRVGGKLEGEDEGSTSWCTSHSTICIPDSFKGEYH